MEVSILILSNLANLENSGKYSNNKNLIKRVWYLAVCLRIKLFSDIEVCLYAIPERKAFKWQKIKTERYMHMFAEKRNSDTVKKVYLKSNLFYLVSLIEHKSDVDYNTIMQVFRYIAFIWENYEKEQKKYIPEYVLKMITEKKQ